MKKILILFLLFIFCLGIVNAETVDLDNVDSGSLSTWYQYYSGYNPTATYEEIVSPYDGGTAIKTSVYGNTIMNCDTKYITKEYDLEHTQNTDDTLLNAYLEFEYDGTYYNFPYLAVQLYDNEGNFVGQNIWYGKNIVGGLYQSYIAQDPTSYTELESDKGYFELNLKEVGDNIEYKKIKIGLYDYTCIGTNSIVIDEIKFVNEGNETPNEVPEFGLIGATLVIVGALGFLIFRKK